MPAVEALPVVRVVASPAALDAAVWPPNAVVMRVAADEVFVTEAITVRVEDPHAIIELDESLAVARMSRAELDRWMDRESEWRLPSSTSIFAQGMVAGLPVKIWARGEEAMVVTRRSLGRELEERL